MNREQINRRAFLATIAGVSAASCLDTPWASASPAHDDDLPSIWRDGQLLAFSAIDGPTDYQSGLVARSMADPLRLLIVHPAMAEIRFGQRVAGPLQITSDTFLLPTESGLVRGALLDTHHILIEGKCSLSVLPNKLRKESEGNRTLLGSSDYFKPQLLHADLADGMLRRQAWLRNQKIPSHLPLRRQRTLRKAFSVMKGQLNSPEGLIKHRWTTPDRWPHRDLWLWDSVFHALGWRHIAKGIARETLEAVFDGQLPDGCIPHQLSPLKSSRITQPPLLAFGVQALAGKPLDLEWVRRCYPKLTKYLKWDFEQRKGSDEAAHWFIDTDPLSRSGESGMDNSPRFDSATRLYAVDFSAFLSLECSIMADFAAALHLPLEAKEWTRKHEALNRHINALMWDEESGFYFDYDPERQKQTKVFAVSGFLPLLCGAADANKVSRLVAHVANQETFGTKVPLPSAVVKDGLANAHDMWRGPMWVNTNWLVAYGLERSGCRREASALRAATMDEIERWYLERGSIFEFYDQNGVIPPDKLPRKGRLDTSSPYHQAIHDYGWSCTLYADLVSEASNLHDAEKNRSNS